MGKHPATGFGKLQAKWKPDVAEANDGRIELRGLVHEFYILIKIKMKISSKIEDRRWNMGNSRTRD